MFADSLLESSPQARGYRGWATLSSFTLQAACVGLLLLAPLIHYEAIPLQLLQRDVWLTPPLAAPPAPPRGVRVIHSEFAPGVGLQAPTVIPRGIHISTEPEVLAPPDGVGIIGAPPTAYDPNAVAHSVLSAIVHPPVIAPPHVVTPRVVHVSTGVSEGLLVHRVTPIYPSLARQARIQGSVVLAALISREGSIENLQVISGHPMLVAAAVEAVRQWRYRPYLLNNQPVAVDTQITVNFSLSQ